MQVTDGVGERGELLMLLPLISYTSGEAGRHGGPSIQTVTGNAALSLPRTPGVPLPGPVCYLNVLLANQPGPVGQDLVDLTEPAEFGGDAVQPSQPQGVAAHP